MHGNHGSDISRKEFIGRSLAGAGAAALGLAGSPRPARPAEPAGKTVRLGFIGLGKRGRALMHNALLLPDIEYPAICDVSTDALDQATEILREAGKPEPARYGRGEKDFLRLLERDDLDAVIIAAPWHWHTPMAVQTMKHGIRPGVEVPAALTIDECWELVDTSEQTGVPCMMLENWSFRRDNLAVLNMIRRGLLGEVVHCHCAHSHDCIDHWFFGPENGEMRWGGEYLTWRNADQYPTHSLGPVLSWMNIGCGDYFDYMTSTATAQRGINAYFEERFGPGHPNSSRRFAQGDIVTSVVRTIQGRTIVINYDMQLPRPYDNRWMIQGTRGVYNEQRQAVYLKGVSPEYHEWEPFEPYQEKYEHAWWRELNDIELDLGHGGTDYLELRKFVESVRADAPPPIDVYDSVAMSVITPLSEMSIAGGSRPVQCPDFTRGRWRTREPYFALNM